MKYITCIKFTSIIYVKYKFKTAGIKVTAIKLLNKQTRLSCLSGNMRKKHLEVKT